MLLAHYAWRVLAHANRERKKLGAFDTPSELHTGNNTEHRGELMPMYWKPSSSVVIGTRLMAREKVAESTKGG